MPICPKKYQQPFPAIIALAIVVLLAAGAFTRNAIWVTRMSLWTDVAGKTPGKSRVRNSLGNCYMLDNRPFEAIAEYGEAIRLDRNNLEAYYNLATNLDNVGLPDRALPYYVFFCKNGLSSYEEAAKKACARSDVLPQEKP